MCRDAATHRMAYDRNPGRLKPLAGTIKDGLCIVQRIQPRAVTPAQPILHPPHLNVGAESASQRTGEEQHPEMRKLPASRGAVAAHFSARQHHHTAALILVHPHAAYSQQSARRIGWLSYTLGRAMSTIAWPEVIGGPDGAYRIV